MGKTDSERQRRRHQKLRAQGLVPVNVWVPSHRREEIRNLARTWCEAYQAQEMPEDVTERCILAARSLGPAPLARFAADTDPRIRAAAAANPHTPPDALADLADDPVEDVRVAAAANPNAPAGGRAPRERQGEAE